MSLTKTQGDEPVAAPVPQGASQSGSLVGTSTSGVAQASNVPAGTTPAPPPPSTPETVQPSHTHKMPKIDIQLSTSDPSNSTVRDRFGSSRVHIGIGIKPFKAPTSAGQWSIVHTTIIWKGTKMRVLSFPVYRKGIIVAVMQSARSMTEVERPMRLVTKTLAHIAPIILLIAGSAGMLLTSRALQPIKALRKSIEETEARNLSARLPITSKDEIGELTSAYNRMLSRLEKAFREKDRFIADASHELRTPLTIMRGNTSLTLSRRWEIDEYIHSISTIHRAAVRMSTMVDDLLLLARADAQELQSVAEQIDVADLLREAIDLAPAYRERTVLHEIPGDPVKVCGSASLLARLFANILANADKFSDSKTSIIVSVHKTNAWAMIEIVDEGQGIAPEDLPYVTDRFYQVDPARSQKSGGSGLGLAICKSIVELHRGTLNIQSTPGKGTTVTVMLPIS